MKFAKIKGFTITTVDEKGEEGTDYTVEFDGEDIWLKDGISDSLIIDPEAWPKIKDAVDTLLNDNKRPGGSDD